METKNVSWYVYVGVLCVGWVGVCGCVWGCVWVSLLNLVWSMSIMLDAEQLVAILFYRSEGEVCIVVVVVVVFFFIDLLCEQNVNVCALSQVAKLWCYRLIGKVLVSGWFFSGGCCLEPVLSFQLFPQLLEILVAQEISYFSHKPCKISWLKIVGFGSY